MKQLKFNPDKDMKELEKFGYIKHQIEGAKVNYCKFEDVFIKRIFKDGSVDIQYPTYLSYMEPFDLENIYKEEIKANLLIVESDEDEC